ncbi:MAG: ATP-binding protein [Bryobacterales bacterium]|nr:ATP-binding protein [Bryobacterales bacterium]
MSNRSRADELFSEFKATGEGMIDRLISEEVSEGLFIDYKRSANNGDGERLHDTDRENLARAIAGFGNAEGGVIVWGVDCRRDPKRGDLPNGKCPIKRPRRFASWLEGTASSCTVPRHSKLSHHAFERPGAQEGFVVSLVPMSQYRPHCCIVGRHTDRYFIRIGSEFLPAPHSFLASMFGQHPAPSVFVMWGVGGEPSPAIGATAISVWKQVIIRNAGVVAAQDLFVNARYLVPGPNCAFQMTSRDPRWEFHESALGSWHLISSPGFRLAPEANVDPYLVRMTLCPPYERSFSYTISYGCAGGPVQQVTGTVAPDIIDEAVTQFLASDTDSNSGSHLAWKIFDLDRVAEMCRIAFGAVE